MGTVVYLLCAVTSLLCSALLLRSWSTGRARLLLWSGLCFAFLSLSNALIAVDLIVFPEMDLWGARNVAALVGVSLLLYGLILESQ